MGKAAETQLKAVLAWHAKATAKENNRPVLTYSLVDTDAMVSSNSYSMHVTFGDFSTLPTVGGLYAHKNSADLNDACKFPNWRVLIPTSAAWRVSFTVGQMIQAVKTARVFSKESRESTSFILRRSDGFVAVVGRSAEHGHAASNVAADYGDAPDDFPLAFALDASLVLAALSGFEDDARITLSTNGYMQPVVIGTPERFALIMPLSTSRAGDKSDQYEYTRRVLELVDPSRPADYNPPVNWKTAETKQRREWEKRLRSISTFAVEAHRRELDAQKARKAREADRPFVELPGGARIICEYRPPATPEPVAPIRLTLAQLAPIARTFTAAPIRTKSGVDGVALYDPHRTQGAIFIVPDGASTKVIWRQDCGGRVETNFAARLPLLHGEVLSALLGAREAASV